MSQSTRQSTKAKAAANRASEARADRRRRSMVFALVAGVLLLIAAAVGWSLLRANEAAAPAGASATPSSIAGLTTYPNQSSKHVDGAVAYSQRPPVGGDHSAVWQNAGIYDAPVPNENAVHTLEHGGFWITYQPGLPADQIAQITSAVRGQAYALVSPYPGQPSPIEATAWGVQLRLESASDPRLAEFIAAYSDGSKAPEPRGEVTGGTGTPTG